jgi:heme-degrading monooxygenase HmoA
MQNVVVLFSAPEFTAEDFEKVWEDLREAGHGNPMGLISHVAFSGPDGGWMVVDVWESEEAFDHFGAKLMPIIKKNKVKLPPPQVIPAHFVMVPNMEALPL